MKLELEQGEMILLTLQGTDGEILIDYDSDGSMRLRIMVDMPDSSGREGEIYCEDFSPDDEADEAVLHDEDGEGSSVEYDEVTDDES